MAFRWFHFGCILLLANAFSARGGDAKTDQETLQGTWELVEMVANGTIVKLDGGLRL